jgi:Phage Mu protein F like protein
MTLEELNAVLQAAAATVEEAYTPKLARRYESALRSAGARMERAFKAKAIAGDASALTAAGRFLPPDEDDVLGTQETADDVGAQTNPTRSRAAALLQAELEAAGISFTVGGIFAEELLDQIGIRATFATNRALRELYQGVIKQAMDEGWSIPRTARTIRGSVQRMAPHRAVALARTDLIGLANAGNHRAATIATENRAPGTTFKQWLATLDGRTRPEHAAAHGQTVPMPEPFTVGGEPLQYPGDPGGSSENVMNCRCTTIYQDSPAGEPAIRASADTHEHAEEEVAMSTTETETQETEAEREPVAWEAVLAVEGEPTEDGRLLETGSTSWRDLPLTLMGLTETGFGHDGAQASGRIDAISRDGSLIRASGELTTEFGIDTLAPMIDDRTVRGVSVDLAVLEYEYRNADTGETVSIEEVMFDEDLEVLFVVLEGVILGATVCPMQAIEQAEIVVAGPHGFRTTIFVPFDRAPAITASAAGLATSLPSRDAFAISEFPGPTPLTRTEDGRIFGHLATWDTCHVGIPGVCTTAPRSASGYAYFHVGELETAEGDRIDVGKLMFSTKHATIDAGRKAAAAHYDDTGMVGGYVRASDGEFGIWISGVVNPELPASRVRELTLNPPSGDWRRINGSLELIAALSVPVPGLPIPRAEAGLRASADTVEVTSLIASAGLIVPDALVASAMAQAGAAMPEEIDGVQEIAALID